MYIKELNGGESRRDVACYVSTNDHDPTHENMKKETAISPIKRTKIEIKPEFSQFKLTPEYINLKKDLQDTIQTNKRELINCSSYNYLGMSGDRIQ